jgi:hypothetical protein
MNYYILNERGEPEAVSDIHKWSSWLGAHHPNRVAEAQIGESWISTVFLGIDHNWSGKGPPVLWETMVFGGKLNEDQVRCGGSREQAEAMHALMVDRVKLAEGWLRVGSAARWAHGK